MSFNYIVLVGNIVQNPELRFTPDGKPVSKFSVAVKRPVKDNNEVITDYIRIITFGKLAENASQNLKKNELIGVEGRLVNRVYEERGKKNKVVEVEAFNIQTIQNQSILANTLEIKDRIPF